MQEVIEDNRISMDCGTDECCSIAESMIEEIHQIGLHDRSMQSPANGRQKGSFKKKLLRQIRVARKMAMI